MNSELVCNFSRCFQKLNGNAYVLICGHLFCEIHNSSLLQDCPLCMTPVSRALLNLNPKCIANNKKLSLLGCSPSDILESASIALEFWNFQKNIEFQKHINKNECQNSQFDRDKQEEFENLNMKYKHLQQKYSELEENYKKSNHTLKANISETPVIFCPPSNQIVKKRANEEGNRRKNLFTPYN